MTNEKSIYGHENNFPTINSCQFIHRTWGGVWVVIAISSLSLKAPILIRNDSLTSEESKAKDNL